MTEHRKNLGERISQSGDEERDFNQPGNTNSVHTSENSQNRSHRSENTRHSYSPYENIRQRSGSSDSYHHTSGPYEDYQEKYDSSEYNKISGYDRYNQERYGIQSGKTSAGFSLNTQATYYGNSLNDPFMYPSENS